MERYAHHRRQTRDDGQKLLPGETPAALRDRVAQFFSCHAAEDYAARFGLRRLRWFYVATRNGVIASGRRIALPRAAEVGQFHTSAVAVRRDAASRDCPQYTQSECPNHGLGR